MAKLKKGVRDAINQLERSEMKSLLEGAGFAVYDSETDGTLRNAIRQGILDGDFKPCDLSTYQGD